jgi:NAD(P)-dependent dehydrogenase (short-subunit alcohol dehydrogenase family)
MSAVEVNLEKKVILVTGASGGIGSKIVERSLAAGACVVAFDLKDSAMEHKNLLKINGSVTHEREVKDCVGQGLDKFGRIDILVNNAGIVGKGRVEETPLEDWMRVLNTNLTGAFLFSKHAIPSLKESHGNVINLASTNGLTGGSHLSGAAYACSKAGIIALTKNLAKDLVSDGVRVNCIAPGPVDTEMINRFGADVIEDLLQSVPLKEFATPDDVANLVFFLASDAAKHITGVTISLSGGLVLH